MNYSLSMSMGLIFSMLTWTLEMAFIALIIPKFEFPLKIWPINMYIVLELLKLRFFGFVAEDPGVLDEEVLLHPGDYLQRWFRNSKIRILLEKLACRHVHCLRVPNQCRFRVVGRFRPTARALIKLQDNVP